MNYKEIEGLRKVDQFHYGNDVINIYQGFVEGVRVTFIDPECGTSESGAYTAEATTTLSNSVLLGRQQAAYMKRANCFQTSCTFTIGRLRRQYGVQTDPKQPPRR